MTANDEYEITWKEVPVAYFNIQYYFPGGNEENHETPTSGQSVVRKRFGPETSEI
jgi:hypothetical protein